MGRIKKLKNNEVIMLVQSSLEVKENEESMKKVIAELRSINNLSDLQKSQLIKDKMEENNKNKKKKRAAKC